MENIDIKKENEDAQTRDDIAMKIFWDLYNRQVLPNLNENKMNRYDLSNIESKLKLIAKFSYTVADNVRKARLGAFE